MSRRDDGPDEEAADSQFWMLYVGGAFALTGVGAFLAILAVDHGRGALTAW